MSYYKALAAKNNKEVAEALDLPPTTISSWNTGRHLPDMDRLQRLAKYLNAPVDQFFDFSLDRIRDKDLEHLHTQLDIDTELVKFLKVFTTLSDEDKHLIMLLSIKLHK
jgi:transcriptional regulator with XRE-family HTH domain